MQNIELAIISSYPTNVSGIVVLLSTKHLTLIEVLNVNPRVVDSQTVRQGGQMPPPQIN